MAEFIVPTNATLHSARSFLSISKYFNLSETRATLTLHSKWMHIEPFALSMIAAWAGWCQEHSLDVDVPSITKTSDYAWRMNLFQYLPVDYHPPRIEHEEAGRFMPIKNVRNNSEAKTAIADISALLHLTDYPESLAAVQYCISELITQK